MSTPAASASGKAGPAKGPILIVGGDGQLGKAIASLCEREALPYITTTRRPLPPDDQRFQFDLAAESWPPLPECSAAIICAAVTSQDLCRRDPVGTRKINVEQTTCLIRQLVEAGTFVVFLSTNLVFDGQKPRRPAADEQCPLVEYGRQKAEVERALRAWPQKTAVVRLTKVIHAELSLLKNWNQALGANQHIRAFSNYICAPVNLATVVAGIARIATRQLSGIWQFSAPADMAYADIARHLAKRLGRDPSLVQAVPAPADSVEQAPAHTSLDASRAEKELGLKFPEGPAVLDEVLS